MNWFSKKNGYGDILCGVYCILNTSTGEKYTGGAKDVYSRWRAHFWELTRGTSNCLKLQNSWNLHPGCWVFGIVEITSLKELRDRETFWILKFGTVNHGYNICSEADAPMEGRKHSPETLESYKKRKASPAQRAALLEYARGPRSTETRIKSSRSLKGRSFPHLFRPCKSETKKLLSDQRKGKVPEAAVQAAALVNKGIHRSIEEKQHLAFVVGQMRWVNDSRNNRRISGEQLAGYLESGWRLGRLMDWHPERGITKL